MDDTLTRGNDPRYREALLDRLGDRDPIGELAALFERLPSVLEGLGDDALTVPEADGKWSIIQVISHLADTELVQGWRIRRILTEDEPALEPMDPDMWASRLGYEQQSLDDVLDQLRALRSANLRLVAKLRPDELQRTALHLERGSESLATLLALVAAHDGVHLDQIRRIRSAIDGPAASDA
jgi:hypothetical protein